MQPTFHILLSLLLSAPLAAQDVATDSSAGSAPGAPVADGAPHGREAVLEGREVVGHRDRAGSTTVLTRNDLERAATLGDALSRVPGVQVRSMGGLGGYTTLSLRGSPSEQVEVRLDGVPLGGSCGSGTDLGPISLDGLDRASVEQAGGGGGDGAPRLNLVSRRGWARLGGSIRTGSFGERGASGVWGDAGGRATVSGWWETSRNDYPFPWDGKTPDDPGDDRIRRLSNNDFTGWGAAFALRPAPEWEAAARWEGSERGIASPKLPDPRGRWNRNAVQASLDGVDDGNWKNGLHASWRRAWSDWKDPERSTGYLSSRSAEETSDDGRLSWGLEGRSGGWWDPRAGVGARWERSVRRSVGEMGTLETPDGSRVTLGLPLGWSGRDGEVWGLDLDGRFDLVRDGRDFRQGISGAKNSTDTAMWRTAFRGQVRLWKGWGPGWSSWICVAGRERLPDFSEWMGGSGGGLPNPDLVSEKSRTVEAGTRFSFAGFEASTSLWDAVYRDPIEATTAGGTPLVVHANIPGWEAAGIDGRVSGKLGRFGILAAGTLQKARVSDPNPAIDGREPRRTPRWRGSLEGSSELAYGLSAGWTLDAQGATWATELNGSDDFRPGRALQGLWIRWRRGGLIILASARNITDVHTDDVEDLPLSGRQFQVRMDLEFSNPGGAAKAAGAPHQENQE